MNSLSPRQISLSLHLFFLALLFVVTRKPDGDEKIIIPVVYQMPTEVMNIKEIKKETTVAIKSVNQVIEKKGPVREVFGLNRNSLTDNTNSGTGISVKMGNTTAKKTDDLVLSATDSDSLPVPAEEYLVSQMPRVINEVKPNYPKAAREKELEGNIVLDVLIDEKGLVRQVNIIEGAEVFRQEAVDAMTKYRFTPANINGKAVAVKIRYVMKFKLEY